MEPWPIFGAYGAEATQKNLYKEVDDDFPDAVLHIGDISYAVGFNFHSSSIYLSFSFLFYRSYSSEWDSFEHEIAPVASRVPYLTCIGNHERDMPFSG